MIHNKLQNITKKLFFLLMMVLLGSTSLLKADELTVYDGTTTNNHVPMYVFYFDEWTRAQFVIPAEDLADMDGGTISAIKFYTTSSNIPYTTVNAFDIYVKEVDYTSISAYEAIESCQTVYSGTGDFVAEGNGGMITITFDTPYDYNGGNLLIGCDNTTKSNYKNISFYGTTVTGASISGSSSSSTAAVSAGQQNFIPKTTFIYEAGGGTKYQVSAVVNPEGTGSVTGTGKYYENSECTLTAIPELGYYFVNWTDEAGDEVSTEASYTFTVTREVTFTANFAESPTHVVTLSTNPEESGYIFTGAGTYYENQECTVAVYNDNDYLFLNWTKDGEVVSTSVIYTFTVIEDVSLVANFATYDAVTYYDGNITNFYIPVNLANTNYYSQSQLVMPAEDLTALVGKSIKGMTFYVNDWITNWYDSEFKVYMTEHPTEAIYEFIDMNEATTVYEGALSIRNNELTISFNTPYDYYGGHLLIGINNMTLGTPYYVCFMGVDKRDASVADFSSGNNFSNFYPSKINFLPKTKFYFGNDAAPLYNVTAVVNPEDAGYVYGAGMYPEGGTCILEAYANAGYTFVNWTVGNEVVSTYASYEFTVTGDIEAVANFAPALEIIPNPAVMGYRPNNAWMRPYAVTLHNGSYNGVWVYDITVDNEYFQIINDIEFPIWIDSDEELVLDIMHTTGEGAITGNLVINYGDNITVMCELSAIAYEPGEADVWETAVEVNEYPYVGTAAGIYHNYMIPEAAEGANDAVYKITVDQLSTLEVTTGSVESVFAVYPEDFNGVGGPDLENTYSYGMPVVVNNWFTEGFEGGLNDWWTIDVNADGGTWIHSDENHGGYDYTERAHSGTGFAMCYSYVDYVGAYNTDSYMVTPQMYSIEVGSTLTFWADNANDSYPEYFTVCVSTAENPTADDFIEIWSGSAKGRSNSQAKVRHTENTRYDNWRFHAIDLSEFAGQNVWIAFHDVNYDMYEIWIDDVELSVNRGREVAEDGFVVEAGTYYVVVAAAANEFPVSINLNDAPAPVEAQLVYPANESINVSAPCQLVWTLGAYTEEMQVLFGTTNPPTDVLVDWTNELVNSALVEELENNTVYYVQINERNNSATTYGTVASFVSHLDVPVLTTEHTWYAYEGEDLKVSWNAIENEDILSYNVYVNNELAVNTIELEYTLSNVQHNLTTGYDIRVTAVYTLGESEKSNDVLFLVTGNGSVAGVVYEQDGETPIANAVVMFVGDDVFGLPVSEQFITNEQGEYLGTLPYGYYLGYANKMGYQQATCSQIIVYYDQTTEGVNFMMKEEYNPVASVTVTPGDEAATVEWSFNDRSFQFNRVYFAGAYSDEKVLLADSLYNTTTYVDNTWAELPVGSYKYGVASVYEGNAGGTRDNEEIVIGEATGTSSYVPTYNLYNYSCTNQIYTGEEIGGAGTINSISFMPVTVNEGAESRNIDIYMVNTEKTAFVNSTDWVPVTSADLVFSGTAYWTAGEWTTITLDTPFDFDGTNLCVVVNDLTGTWTSANKYNVFNATAQAIRIYRDEAAYDPADPGAGAVLNVKNCIKLEMRSLAGNESPIVWSEPVDKDMYTTLSLTVTLNSGESPEGAEVTIINVDENEQALYPVEPVVLDETGIYTWDSFRKGFYTISITKEGYDESFGYYSIYEPTELTINLVESTEMVSGLYVSPTGYAMWADALPVEDVYWMESFENGIPEGWSLIDMDGDGYNWRMASEVMTAYTPYDGSEMIISQSWDNGTVLYPDNYLVTPLQHIANGTTFSFWAAAQDASWASEHFGVAVSEDGLRFYTLAEWTMTAKGSGAPTNNTKDGSRAMGNWYQYSVDLSDYAGSDLYIAIRHFNCSDMYYLDVDNVEFTTGAKGGRYYESYHIMLVDTEGEVFMEEDTLEDQMQLPVDELVEGETYLFRVANKYSSGLTDYTEYFWTYYPCDNYEGAESVVYTALEDGNMVTWDNPAAKTLLMRDGESLGFINNNYYFDEGDTDEHEYVIRIVYPDYAMACEQEAEYKDLFYITAIANEGGLVNGNVEYSAVLFEDSYCTLEAEPYYGYTFKNWTKDGEVVSTDAVYTFVVEGDAEFEANFVDMHNYFIVNPNTYENTMTMTGIVKIDGVALESMYYELGAIGEGADGEEEVRGSAFLEHVNIGINGEIIDGYYLFMTFYGNNDDELTFKLYDHNTSTLEDLMCTSNVTFEANEILGTLLDPYAVNFMNVISVDYNFTTGWNWWSTNVELTAIDGMAMLEEGLGENATQISAQAAFTNYYAGYGWYGSLTTINNESMYRVQMNAATSFSMVGPKADPADHPITMTKGWNHIGYVSDAEMSVSEALAGVTAVQGDMVKSQKSYANYYPGYGWYGSLNTIKPGDGLMYKSTSDDAITFTYPVANNTREMMANLTGDNNHWVPSVNSYANNMTVMAVVEMNGEELASDNYELAAFVNGECRGSIQLVYAEPINRYVAFLTVSGDEVANMTFGLFDNATGEESFSSIIAAYSNDAVLGNPSEPFVVSFNNSSSDMTLYPNPVTKGEQIRLMMSGDQKVVVEIANALGKVVSVETVTSMSQGIAAPEAAGVYTVRIISEGNEVKCQKLVVR